ncbi:MAG: hypothetical protein K2X81_03820 [Candidatus Obscuribacterales bacterium]|nr:hypothetical protein [Candidatus Obscuribacterales bacterium]
MDFPDSLPCKYKVGFLFKRICGRMDRAGCKFCEGGSITPGSNLNNSNNDPYFRDRNMYYNDYYYSNRHNFTDSDASSLSVEQDTDYETDLDAS